MVTLVENDAAKGLEEQLAIILWPELVALFGRQPVVAFSFLDRFICRVVLDELVVARHPATS